MYVRVVTQPAANLLDLGVVKKHLHVDFDDDDALITAYASAAVGNLDGPDGWLGRALSAQALEAQFDRFPVCLDEYLDLPCPPLVAVTAVKYDDADGVEQTLDPTLFTVDPRGIVSAVGQPWPSTFLRRGAVRVTYQAGYDSLPPAILAALLLMIGDLYANRETSAEGRVASIPMSTTVERLLAPFRVWTI